MTLNRHHFLAVTSDTSFLSYHVAVCILLREREEYSLESRNVRGSFLPFGAFNNLLSPIYVQIEPFRRTPRFGRGTVIFSTKFKLKKKKNSRNTDLQLQPFIVFIIVPSMKFCPTIVSNFVIQLADPSWTH